MSFSAGIKEECAHSPMKNACCARAELAGWALLGGAMGLSGRGVRLTLPCDSPALSARLLALVKRLYGIQAELMAVSTHRLGHTQRFQVRLEGDVADRAVRDLGILRQEDGEMALFEGIDPALVERPCCRRAFLRGAFLGAGSVVDPAKDYHLEYVVTREGVARDLCAIAERFSLHAKHVMRKDKIVVYLKEAENISDLLALMGAQSGVLAFENARVIKDMRNRVNRAVNCETANSAKVAEAAARQIACIERIQRSIGLHRLPAPLREVAEARLDAPDASLEELGQMCSPVVGKSGINHRLRRLERFSETLSEEEGEPT